MARVVILGLAVWVAVFAWHAVAPQAVGLEQWQYRANLADITVSGSAAAVFSSSDINAGNGHVQATSAVCALTGANIRITFDGQTPTTNFGQVLTPGVWVFQGNVTLNALQSIRDDSTNGTLRCSVQG